MKVLIVGSGGREHAIAMAVAKSPKVDKIYCAPGNAGIAAQAECVPITAMEFEKLADFAQEKAIDLTIIGMDDPWMYLRSADCAYSDLAKTQQSLRAQRHSPRN